MSYRQLIFKMRNYGTEDNKCKPKNKKRERKWYLIGHTYSKPQGAIERQELDWNIKVERRGEHKKTCKRTREWELQKAGKSWQETKRLALDRNKWKSFK
jgi:hypothetical protein